MWAFDSWGFEQPVVATIGRHTFPKCPKNGAQKKSEENCLSFRWVWMHMRTSFIFSASLEANWACIFLWLLAQRSCPVWIFVQSVTFV